MSFVEDNWQTKRATIRQRTKFVFNNNRCSDINSLFARWMVRAKVNKRFLLTSSCCLSAVLCLRPCFTVSWRRLKTLLNCLIVRTRVSVSLHVQKCSYQGFEVYFDQQINIKRNTSYAISALISGPPTCQGIGCVGSIQWTGVTFTFTNNESSTNGTSTICGQFPELLFSLQ